MTSGRPPVVDTRSASGQVAVRFTRLYSKREPPRVGRSPVSAPASVPERPTAPLVSRALSHAWKAAFVLAVAGGGLWTATHRVAGVAWPDVAALLRHVSPHQLAVLTVIWLGGLGIYSLVLSAALPGLGVRRSLLLNLSGSAVANVVPLGGAVGTALNWRMVTRWGHSNRSFVAYCVLTNVLDVASKLVLPLVAVAGLLLVSAHVPTTMWLVAAGCALTLLTGLGLELLLRRYEGTDRGGRLLTFLADHLRDSATRISEVFALGWLRLLSASAGYLAAQVALLDMSLRTVGMHPPLTVVVMATAVERLGTLIPITPGGAGVAEIGAIAWLVATGQPPVEVVAGVLLCRIFLVALEIPLGGALLVGWVWSRRWGLARPGAGAA